MCARINACALCAQSPDTHAITDFVSFYTLSSFVLNNPKHKVCADMVVCVVCVCGVCVCVVCRCTQSCRRFVLNNPKHKVCAHMVVCVCVVYMCGVCVVCVCEIECLYAHV